MAGKKKGSKDDDGSEDGAEDAEATETDDDEDGKGKKDKQAEPPSARAGYIGLGLVGSLVVGFDPLRDAFQGNGSFENAVFRYLACVAVCVVGAGTIGRLIDSSTPGGNAKKKDGDAAGRTVKPIEAGSGVGAAELVDTAETDAVSGAELPSGDEDNEPISAGPAKLAEVGRQEDHQQPLTSSEETSR